MSDKRAGIDIYRRHRFGLVDNQITAGLEFNLTLQRALDLIFHVIKIEDRLMATVMLQLTGHFRDVFCSKLQQRLIGQT